jgi:H+-transporting ATPase
MVIQEDCPTYTPGETYESVLFQAALAAKWKEPPRDALDTMVLKTSGQDLRKCDKYEQLDFVPFDPRTKRTEGKLKGPDGNIFRITKGAPHVVMEMCHNKEELRQQVEDKVHELGTRGVRSLALARMDNEDGIWKMLGILTFLDPPRPDTKMTIEKCAFYGVRVKMITGDHLVIAKETARVLGMGPRIYAAQGLPVLGEDGKIPDGLVEQYGTKICPADGFASVFPEHKYLIVETLRQAGFRCGMTGDGVNDAPALKRADVGIAVQGATDAARAAADLVLTGEGLSVIIDGIEVARETFARLKNFISYRIAATLQLLLFFFIALFAFPPETYYNKYGFQMETGNYPGEYIQVPRMSSYCPGGVAYLCLCPLSVSVTCLCLISVPKPLSLSLTLVCLSVPCLYSFKLSGT